MIQRTDLLTVGYWMGSSAAGQYQVALRLPEVAASFFGALMIFFLPEIARAGSARGRRTRFIQATILGSFLILPPLMLVGVWGDFVTAVLFGDSFAVSASVYAVLAAGLMVQVAASPNGFVLVATRSHRLLIVIGVVVFTLNLGLNVLLVPLFGLVGAASASSVSFAVLNLSYGLAIQRAVGRIRWRNRVVTWTLRYLLLLSLAATLPRLAMGKNAAGLALSVVVVALLVLSSARSQLVRPVLQNFIRAIRREQPNIDRLS